MIRAFYRVFDGEAVVVGCSVVADERMEHGWVTDGDGEESAAHGHHEPGVGEADGDCMLLVEGVDGGYLALTVVV